MKRKKIYLIENYYKRIYVIELHNQLFAYFILFFSIIIIIIINTIFYELRKSTLRKTNIFTQ